MAEPSGSLFPGAVFFDGKTNAKHIVTIRLAEALEILEDGVFIAAWSYADIRRADGPADVLRLSNIAAAPLARLEIRDEAAQAEVRILCALLEGDPTLGSESKKRILFWSLAATVSIGLIVWYGIPALAERLTPLVPVTLEKHIGAATDKQLRAIFSGKVCTDEKGRLALVELVGKLQDAAGLPIAPEPDVIQSGVPNAFALPGGKVYVLSKLLDRAESPDEVAGVLAHEFGHVAHRDGMRRLIKDGSTSFVIGLLFGDVTGSSVILTAGKSLLSAAYSRDVEASADHYAQGVMLKLGRPPKALGTLMVRILGEDERSPLAIFASHPLTKERVAALSASDEASGAPLLSDEQWRDLKAICH